MASGVAHVALWLLAAEAYGYLVSGEQNHCEPMQIPMCKSMLWNITVMPNLMHQSTQLNARLAIEQYDALVLQNCSTDLLFYLCALYAPICTPAFQSDPVPPCRSVCENARKSCEPIVLRYNRTWPEALSCSRLPTYEDGVCISPEAFVSDTVEEQKVLEDCECKKGPKFRKEDYIKNNYDYVIKATVQSQTTQVAEGKTVTTVTVQRVMRNRDVRAAVTEGRLIQLWTPSAACECHRLLAGREYLLACYHDKDNDRLLLNTTSCMAMRWQNEWLATIEEWNAVSPTTDKKKDPRRGTTVPAITAKAKSPHVKRTKHKQMTGGLTGNVRAVKAVSPVTAIEKRTRAN